MLSLAEIRRAVFVHEFGCTEDEEFDGNDFSATQIIARVHGQVAGTMRVRYFADFIIPERLAVLPQFRKGRYGARGVAFALGTFGFNFARMKGYRHFVGYSVLGLERFWDHLAMASDGLLPTRDDLDPERYAAHAQTWLRAGARVIGGCCGTGPQHIVRLKQLIGGGK